MKDNQTAHRFELEEQGHTAFADYQLEDSTLHILYVEAPPALRGTGAAGRLMQDIVAHAKQQKLTIHPICGYARSWLQRHA